MRLGQLARKLALKPVEIVDFLARQSVQIDPGNNTRIEDEHVVLVLQKYAPGELIENVEKAIAEEEKTPKTTAPENIINELPPINAAPEEAPINEERIEVIKAPKIELSGLKVLGKIELPETKKKEAVANAESSTDIPVTNDRDARKPARSSNFQRRERSTQPQRSAKNPIAAQREQEAREAELKRKEQIERDKEKRTLHYLKKVNVAQPVKAVKILDEKIERQQVIKAPPPATLWGRFKHWLSS